MHLIPRWKVLLGGIVLLLCTVALVVRPSFQLASIRPYLVSPWSPDRQKGNTEKDGPPPIKYKPDPTFAVPPIRDPFPLLSQTTAPPPIPAYNVPEKDAWRAYAGLEVAPPLLIGFTRNWPMLLQAVVSYLTAGWPAEQLYVVENTGAQQANARGLLGLQNPRFLNHTQLTRVLGVRVVQTPVLLSFAQLQNFYLALSYEHAWPYYFWSHMDVVALSHEAGVPGLTAPAGEPGYKSLYTLCLETLQQTIRSDSNKAADSGDKTNPGPVESREKKKNNFFSAFSSSPSPSPSPPPPQPRWAARFFAYDHLTLQNPKALEAIGGWDTFIPYYMTDCDAYSRFAMDGWTVEPADAGVVTDTASVFDDLRALYRDPGVVPRFTDPNPPPPGSERRTDAGRNPEEEVVAGISSSSDSATPLQKRDVPFPHEPLNMSLPTDYWWQLRREADNMFHHKHGGQRGRNTWQWAQRGGREDPFYYDPAGFEEAVQVLTEAGRNVFARKWGHRDCDLGRYKIGDQWRVEKDW
ncbi:hypothetical protein PG999_001826 [Apiospora kogelbergensis]|uniref:Uncharacterized protein n=1 Tax=Apiospora kogelbergensis TaxID=1337665 RepID=A0AAW0R6N4_9PEZI